MAAAPSPTTSGIQQNLPKNKQDEKSRPPTVEEILIQIENHLYSSIEHRASLLIAAWTCLGGQIGYFRNIEKVFHMMYRESALMIFSRHWTKVDIFFKRGLSRAIIQYSHSMGSYVKKSEGLCSSLVMAVYDPWGDPVIHQLMSNKDIDLSKVKDFVKSEPHELLLIRVECLVNARCEEAAIRLCRSCLQSDDSLRADADSEFDDGYWRLSFLEWLLRLLFRKRRLNDLVTESSSCSCHDGVRLIHRTLHSKTEDSEPLTESLINLFLVRDLLFKSKYCCTSDLMGLWCELQARKQRPLLEIQEAARKLLVGHASSSAQFYLFVDILWGKFGISLLPLYLELYVRGLTSDLNFLEAARQTDRKEYVIELENHMAAMYFKLSSLFSSLNKDISLECLLSAFSLNPTREVLEWIKKITLQISKEKALKAAGNNDIGNNNRSSCTHSHNCVYPAPTKRKAVVMCDQAIQVGDDSFVECERAAKTPCRRNSTNHKDDSISESKELDCEAIGLEANGASESNAKSIESATSLLEEKQRLEHTDEPVKLPHCLVSAIQDNVLTGALDENIKNTKCTKASVDEVREELPNEDGVERSEEIRQNFEVSNCVNSDKSSTSVSGHNFDISNDYKTNLSHLKCEENSVSSKIDLKENIVPINQPNTSPTTCDTLTNHHINGLDSKEDICVSNTQDGNVELFGKENVSNNDEIDTSLSTPNVKHNILKSEDIISNNSDNSESLSKEIPNEACSSVCINGYGKSETDSVADIADSNAIECNSEGCRIGKTNATIETNVEEADKTLLTPMEIDEGSVTNESSAILNSSSVLEKEISESPEQKADVNLGCNETRVTTRLESLKNQSTFTSISHVILDCNLPGLSNNLLSDFVIVLESLRNKQLKTSSKWSQIKHLCEDYLDIVSDQRYMILNLRLSGSIDSEADSTSELTANGFDDFEYHQSNDSIREDRFADKSHVFKRFMNSDKITEMATYVNLSDIHCPQIPLEKLFYTEYSSSHPGHKKRHKKHRNHDKNPKKLVLRKLRHGNRGERDLVKRKKRKKRKGKRGKGHAKKHHSTHDKVNKLHTKNKRKKHKLKKKKEGNSGFISGDYCSDFSSEELMRIVKEHSNSYSKIPATTSKHPHAIGSASSSDSGEPARKKRKIDKKRGKNDKYHDKHKHIKSNKHKKKITVESCKASLTNIIHDNPISSEINANKDYPHFVQISRVKKMESVQIQQRSVSMLDNSTREASLIPPCVSNPQIQQFVQQNFESYSPEDMMKMQLLMARQQAEVTAGSSTMLTNQALRKYVCSKMTSQLLSVAQSSKCIVGSDSEASKSPTPVYMDKTPNSNVENLSKSRIHPQKISANIKHFVIETNKAPYRMPNSNVATTVSSNITPVSITANSFTEAQNLIGAMLNSNIRCPTTQMTPQVTALSIPISHNPPGGKMVTSKIIIPLPPSNNMRSGPTSSSVVPSETHSFATTSGNSSHTSFIIVKNGNNTQIIQSPQSPCNILPCIQNTLQTKVNPVVSRSAPKMLKQSAKRSAQPVVKRTLIKNPAPPIQNAIKVPKILSKTVPKTIALAAPTPLVTPVVTATEPNALMSVASKPNVTDSLSLKVPIPLHSSPLPTLTEAKSPLTSTPLSSKTDNTESDIVAIKSDSCLSSLPTTPVSKNIADNTCVEAEKKIEDVCEKSEAVDKTDNSEEAAAPEKVVSLDLSKDIDESDVPVVHLPDEQEESTCIVEDSAEKIDSHIDESLEKEPQPEKLESPIHAIKTDGVTDEKAATLTAQSELESGGTSEKSIYTTEESKLLPVDSAVPTDIAKDKEVESQLDSSSTDVANTSTESLISKEDIALAVSSETVADPESAKLSPVKGDQESENKDTGISHSPDSKESNTSASKTNVADDNDQQKQLQPINSISIMASMKTPGKAGSLSKADGSNVSETPTRSFTSISDAVRFSLMDMDDATDSVENQVLQAFQTSHETASQNSPRYDNSSTNDGNGQASPSAVILTVPPVTETTDLNVSRVSQRFEASVHSSQTEKFADCQSTVSRSTTWILEDTSINETSQTINIQKSPDLDSSGEGKEEEKPKKKKKRKDRCDRDPESAHKFWCEICHKGFFSAYNLRRHCRNVHKMNLPRGSSDPPFPNSHAHQHVQQGESSSSEIVSPPRLPYGNTQTSCVSPKGSDYMLQSPTRETKSQDFAAKVATSQHTTTMQTDFQMQTTGTRVTGQPSTHISSSAASKSIQSDFQLPSPTTVSNTHVSPNKLSNATKSPATSKFQRLPTPCSTVSQMSSISACGQQSALQQQRQLSQIQSSGLVQPVPSVACQAQQLQASQCPHFQSKQIAQQRIGQLQMMHHAAQLPTVQHNALGVQKQTPVQQYKKCGSNLQPSKMTETEQIQQNAQLAQTQQILANQQMQKLMQIRQNAIAATGVATQLSLGTAVPGAQPSNVKAATQCFQSQLAVARQAAAVAQLSATQRAQGASFTLASHDSAAHQFFTPSVQPTPEQSSCSHATFTTQNLVEYSANAPSYPTIRLSSEANDGLEDLEQFLLENMPWSSDQAASHSLAQQSGNRPSSADSLTLSIPTQASSQIKSKTPITRPKPRKPVVTSCSKNLLGSLGRGVKKKSAPKKAAKISDINCPVSKSGMFPHSSVNNQQAHGLDLMQMHCDKGISSNPKQACKAVNVNETDSSDSIQCINVGHHIPSKNMSACINFNTFVPAPSIATDKSINSSYNVDMSNQRMYGVQSKNSFLEHGNLVNKNSSNLSQNKNVLNSNPCDINHPHLGNSYSHADKGVPFNPATGFCQSVCSSITTKRSETGQDIFLGQRNSEKGESSNNTDKVHCSAQNVADTNKVDLDHKNQNLLSDNHSDLFLCGRIGDTNNNIVDSSDNTAKSITNTKLGGCVAEGKGADMLNETVICELITDNKAITQKISTTNIVPDCENNSQIDESAISSENCEGSSLVSSKENVTKSNSLGDTDTTTEESIVATVTKESAIEVFTKESIVPGMPSVTKNSNTNLEQMQEFGIKSNSCLAENSSVILKEKFNPSECKLKSVKSINSAKQSFNGFSVSRILDNDSSPDGVNNVSAKKIDNKENVSYPSPIVTLEHTKSVVKNCDKGGFLPKLDCEKDSSHEKQTVNGEKSYPESCVDDNENVEQTAKRIALRVRKSSDVCYKFKESDKLGDEENENDLNIKHYLPGKLPSDTKINRKNNPKKKVIQENTTHNVECKEPSKIEDLKLDINSNIQQPFVEEKEVNGTHCLKNVFCEDIANKLISKESQEIEESYCTKQCGDAPAESISPGRLRLRDTPKSSVKRVCPCCIDSRVPRKCRTKAMGNKVHAVKSKSTLKTRNTSNIQNAKVNTRSSQRLRSRNNTVS